MAGKVALWASGLALWMTAAACMTPGGLADSAYPGFGDQICAGAAGDDVPGYSDPVKVRPAGASRLSGAGSTFVAPMMSAWAKRYADERGTQVAYQPIGSGGAIAQLNAGTVDFGASDVPMSDAEYAAAGTPMLHIPVTLGAVVPAYHVSGLGSGLRFDAETLGGIFGGTIHRWSDVALRRLNPQLALPDQAIVVVHRSDASGTTAVWTDFLTRRSKAWTGVVGLGRGAGKQVVWPVGLGGRGNDGVAGMLAQVDGAIGYLELSYVLAQGVPYGQVLNQAGRFVQPCPATVATATEGLAYPDDLRMSFVDSPQPDGYPIVGATFVIVRAGQHDPATAATLVAFLAWALTVGQDMAAPMGYAPLGRQLQERAFAKLGLITVRGSPVASGTIASPSRLMHGGVRR